MSTPKGWSGSAFEVGDHDMPRVAPNNIPMIKFNYWWNP
jgi:hypothetical protein